MNKIARRIPAFFYRTTFQVMLLYLVLVLLPTSVFIVRYTSELRAQAQAEQRYEKQLRFQQTAQSVQSIVDNAGDIANTMQSTRFLLTLLENDYPSASEELYAYTTYIQPLIQSVINLNAYVDDIYFYRVQPSNIGNSRMVHNLCGMDEMIYPFADLNGTVAFLGEKPGEVFSRDEDEVGGLRYVSLHSLYNSDYTEVIAVMEVQFDINAILSGALPAEENGACELRGSGKCYPLALRDGEWMIGEAREPAEIGPDSLRFSLASAMDLVYYLPGIEARLDMRRVAVVAMLLILPTLLFFIAIQLYARGITRFSVYIHNSGRRLPQPYPDTGRKDEFGDVIREYNAMTRMIQEQVEELHNIEKAKSAAQYYALSFQVNPHFMFNTLENIRMHIEVEEYDTACEMLVMLGQFLRYNISLRQESRLMDELDHARRYVSIYQHRIRNSVTWALEVDESVPNVTCPTCMLQPIVENILKHGLRDMRQPLNIRLHVFAW